MPVRAGLALAVLGAIGCSGATDAAATPPAPVPVVAPKPEPPAPPPEPALTPGVVASLDRTCGECHRSDRETAKPKALAVFDLVEERWWTALDAEQLQSARGRVDDRDDIPADDKLAFARFVAARTS